MTKLLYLGPSDSTALVGRTLGDGWTVMRAEPSEASVDALIADCEFLLDASMKVPLDAARLRRAQSLRAVFTATTGANHIDSAALENRGIPLFTLKGQRDVLHRVNAAAELSWLLLMACARGLRGAIEHVMDGGWDRTQFPGLQLRGRTLGILGCGRNGCWMAAYGNAFGMEVLGCDPAIAEWPHGIVRCEYDDLLRRADAIGIHVTYSHETENLVGARELALMKPGAILINTSRGQIVDEDAVVAAIDSGRLRGYGTDVIATEPDIARSPVWQRARVDRRIIVTPHIGGFSPDALAVVLAFTAQRIVQWAARNPAAMQDGKLDWTQVGKPSI